MKQILRFGSSLRALRFVLLACFAVVSMQGWAYGTVKLELTAGTGGTVSLDDKTYDATASGSNYGNKSYTFTAYAKASHGYIFKNWTGNATSSSNPFNYVMNHPTWFATTTHYLTANFAPIYSSSVAVVASPGGTAVVNGISSTVDSESQNHSYSLSATPDTENGYVFVGWYADEAHTQILSNSANYTYTITAEHLSDNAKTVYAFFSQQLVPSITGENKALNVDDNVASGFTFVNVSNDIPAAVSNGSNFYYTIEQNVTSEQKCPGHVTEVVAYDAENNKLIAYNAGTATITFKQNATSLFVAAEESYTITVNKYNNATITGEDKTLHVDDNVASGFTFANMSNDTPDAVSNGSNFYYTISDQNVTSAQKCPDHEEEVIAYDAANNKLIAYNAGTAIITFTQNETYKLEPVQQSYTITVEKLANAITINGETNYTLSVPFGKQLTVASANPASTIIAEQTSGEEFATYAAGKITTGMAVGQATWNISQDEDYKYLAANATLTVNVEPTAEDVAYVLYDVNGGSQFTGGTSGKMELSGPADKLYFDADFSGGAVNTSVKAQYSVDGSTWVDVPGANAKKKGSYGPYDLSETNAKYIRFVATGSLTQYYKNIKVTRKTYLNVEGLAVNETAEGNPTFLGEQGQATMTVDWSCANGGDLKILCDNDKFTFSQTTIAGVDNNNGKTDVTVTYNSDAVGTEEGHVTIYNDVYRKDITISGTVLAPFTSLAELASHWEAGKVVQFRARVQVVQAQGGAPDVFVCEGNQENHTFIVGASCLNGIESGKWVTVQGKLWYDKRGNWTWAKDHPGCTLAIVGGPEDGTYTPRTLTAEPAEADLFQYVKMQNVRKVDNVLVFGDGKKKIEKEQWWWGDYDNALYDEIYGVIVSNNEATPWKEIQICSGTKAAQQTETINISEAAGFATYAVPFNAAITRNGDAEVWYVSDWTAESLKFTKYEGETLQKGEGVLLKEGNSSVTFTPTDAECQALDGNKLNGNIVPTVFEAGSIFILSNGANGVGFYPNTAGTLKAGKAYLVKSEWEAVAGSAIGEFQMLFDDEETGIGNVNENVNENQSIYNLAGQRIAGLQKGINIVNGKKILK